MRASKFLLFALAGALGGVVGDCATEPFDLFVDMDEWLMPIVVGVWFGVAGSLISICILAAQGMYMRRRGLELRTLVIGMLAGFAAGMLSGILSQTIYQTVGATQPLRVLCWGIAGLLLGLALAMQITNMRPWRGLVGGTAGGLIGGLAFISVSEVAEAMAGRIVGVGLIGIAIGAMLALSEALARVAWLEVRLPDGRRLEVNLGPTRVTIGANQARCIVVVPGAPQLSHAIRMADGAIVCEDLVNHTKSNLRPGDVLQIGRASLRVQGQRLVHDRRPQKEATKSAAPAAARRPSYRR